MPRSLRTRSTRPALLLASALLGAWACGTTPAERKQPCTRAELAGGLGTLCGFAKPEDVEVVEAAGVVLVTEEGWAAPSGGGAIAAVAIPRALEAIEPPFRLWPREEANSEPRGERSLSYGDPSCSFPTALERFSPHGLTSQRLDEARHLVAVVRHGEREAIELFELRTAPDSSATLRWAGCVLLPEDTAGNDVAFAPNGELLVTNFVPTVTGLRSIAYQVAAGLGMATGDVLAWSPARGWRHVPGSAGAMPNGIVVSGDGALAYVAETATRKLYRVRLDGGGARETLATFEGHPDNLSWSPSGTILVALLRGNPDGSLWCRAPLPGCPAPWSLLEVDPQTGKTEELIRHDGSMIHSVTSAARVGQWTFFGSMGDDRIGILVAPTRDAGPSR